jgi:hypothetical protein
MQRSELMYDLDVCRYGDHCRTRTPGQPPRPGRADGRGLCPPDEANGRHAIDQLPLLRAAVLDLVPKDTGRRGLGSIGGAHGSAKVDPPTPLNLGLDAFAQEISYTLGVWAEQVWALLPAIERDRQHPVWWPSRAAGLLAAQYPALRSLGPTLYVPYDTGDGEGPVLSGLAGMAETDGPGAIAQLARLAHKARSIVGEETRLERRALPCPAPYQDPDGTAAVFGCGQDNTLVRRIGPDPTIYCTYCGWWCTEEEYQQYALTFQPPRLGRCPDCRARPGEPHGGCEVRRCMATGLPWGDCDMRHEPVYPGSCGEDVWSGVHPGVSEARQYGVPLAVLLAEGRWDPPTRRWYLERPADTTAAAA